MIARGLLKIGVGVALLFAGISLLTSAYGSGSTTPASADTLPIDSGGADSGSSGDWFWDSSDDGAWDSGSWDSGGWDSGDWGGWDSGSDSGSWDSGGWDSGSWDDGGSDSGSW